MSDSLRALPEDRRVYPGDGSTGPELPRESGVFLLGIVGDSGSGKSTIAEVVERLLGPARVTQLHLDDYHRFSREERAERGLTALNPLAHDLPLMAEHLALLRQGRPVSHRTYLHRDGTFGPIRTIEPAEIVLVRGLLGYPTDELAEQYDLTIFLQPEPELLFRWKLRRDVLSRGYSTAEVLNSIARHLLDSKEFVLPQAERADLQIVYELPDYDAPDSLVATTLVLRRRAATIARAHSLFGELGTLQEEAPGEEIRIRIPAELSAEAVERWIRERFPEQYDPERIGSYTDEGGRIQQRPTLALVQALIADLALRLSAAARPPAAPPAPSGSGALTPPAEG